MRSLFSTRRLLCLSIVPLLLFTAAAPVHESAPTTNAEPIASPLAVTVAFHPLERDELGAIRVAPDITSQWADLATSGAPFAMCLRGVTVGDTLRVERAERAGDCSFGSARSAYRQSCAPAVGDWSAFNDSNERVRFTVCGVGKAFVLLRLPSESVRGSVAVRRGT